MAEKKKYETIRQRNGKTGKYIELKEDEIVQEEKESKKEKKEFKKKLGKNKNKIGGKGVIWR